MEFWKDINGYEGLYRISTLGNIKTLGNGKSTNPNHKKERLIKHTIKKNGYIQIKLFKNGKRKYYTVHRLVAENFLINENDLKEVNHKDGNKTNNDIKNLEWVTASQNQKHAYLIGKQKPKKGVDNKQSKKINQISLNGDLIKIWDSIKTMQKETGFNTFGIISCCKKRKKYKTAYGYKWEYV